MRNLLDALLDFIAITAWCCAVAVIAAFAVGAI